MWVNDKSPGIQCGFCGKLFHGRCVSLSKEQLAFFGSNTAAIYKCDDCRTSNTGKPNNRVDNCESCGVLLDAIKELQLAIETLKNEVKTLRERPSSSITVEDVVREVAERQSREKNIIIHGMISQNKPGGDEHDAYQIIKQIAPNISSEAIKARRLGSGKNGKPAPLKVQLRSRDDVFAVLKNKRKLRELDVSVRITTDNTPIQMDQQRKILQQISERKKNGEEGLYMRYVKGNPTIAKSKN